MRIALSVAFAFALVGGGGTARAQTSLKIATLAPEGSAWMVAFHEWATKVEEHTGGKIKIKFFAGGTAGDERDAVRKMRLGQLNGAAVTSIGLGLINSEVRVLELPMLIGSYDELDYVRNKLDLELRKKFEDKGYVLLAWGDVGPVHIFSNVPLKSKADLAQTKMWAWVDDPLVKELFHQLGTSGVPLGVPDVLPSLQTGLINACYGSPLSMVALQWFTKVKFMTSLNITHSIGATVITKKEYDKLTPELQKTLVADSKEFEIKLLKTLRAENTKALTSIKQAGITVVESPPEMVKQFTTDALAIRPKLEPSVYTHDFRLKVEKLVADYRAGKK
jgi:TRAP-type C4-dicarboxylate transport system substrate-binding protein